MISNEFLSTDRTPPQLSLQIDSSLYDYFRDGMQRDQIAGEPLQELALFLADVLNDTAYPIEAHLLKSGAIKLSYQPRAFADPIF